jgi:putative transposase
VLLQREGWAVNHKWIRRTYREEGLLVRTKRRKKRAAQRRLKPPPPTRVGANWGIDFMSDQLANGLAFGFSQLWITSVGNARVLRRLRSWPQMR